MKYLILLLFIGCSNVDENGITKTVYSGNFYSREGSIINLRSKFNILCLKNGYKNYKVLESYSRRQLRSGVYRSIGTAQCLNKEE